MSTINKYTPRFSGKAQKPSDKEIESKFETLKELSYSGHCNLEKVLLLNFVFRNMK